MTDIKRIEPRIGLLIGRSHADIDEAFATARPRLQRIATSLVGAVHAEDVVHDTYLTARARSGQLRDPLAVEAWLVRICIHRSFRLNRRGRRLRELLQRNPGPERSVPRASGLELRELIDSLAARERTVVILQHGYGYTLLEVAELLGVSHANARKISSRARGRLLLAWREAER